MSKKPYPKEFRDDVVRVARNVSPVSGWIPMNGSGWCAACLVPAGVT